MTTNFLYWWHNSICKCNALLATLTTQSFLQLLSPVRHLFVSDDFCCELASSLAVMLLEFNAELEEFCFQIDNLDQSQGADRSELEAVR